MRMLPVAQYRALLGIDQRMVVRDCMLRWMFVVPIALALAVRYAMPPLNEYLYQQFEFRLLDYSVLLLSAVALMVPNVVGMICGFVLLDQRDDRSLMALQVTPLDPLQIMIARFTTPGLVAIGMVPLVLMVSGLTPLTWASIALITAGSVLLLPLYALWLASFAHNKVQGLALSKAAGIFTLPPIAAWFVDGPWQWVAGILPTFWPMKAFWLIQENALAAWICVAVGIAWQSVLLTLVYRRFGRVIQR